MEERRKKGGDCSRKEREEGRGEGKGMDLLKRGVCIWTGVITELWEYLIVVVVALWWW